MQEPYDDKWMVLGDVLTSERLTWMLLGKQTNNNTNKQNK